MAKIKKAKIEPMIESVEENANGETDVTLVMVHEPRYRNVPVDALTHKQLMALCEARGFGQRGQGAYVRILIKKEFEIMQKSGMVK
jgi:hypothetical protein